MPVRMLREGILDSEAVNSLSAEAEVFYRRLMSVVDDYGRFDARPAVLRSRLYPIKIDAVFEVDVAKWLADCCRAGLVRTYEVDGKPYLEFLRLGSPRAKVSKFPAPHEQACQSERKQTQTTENGQILQMNADENGCAQTHASAPYSYSYSGSGSYSGSRPTSGSAAEAGPEVSRSTDSKFDPLKQSQQNRRDFENAWSMAGLRKFGRLTATLQARLDSLLLDNLWASTWRDALIRAGQIPFLASGSGRQQGPLDPSEFLRDDDFAAAILRGKYDPRQTADADGKPRMSEAERLIQEAIANRRKEAP